MAKVNLDLAKESSIQEVKSLIGEAVATQLSTLKAELISAMSANSGNSFLNTRYEYTASNNVLATPFTGSVKLTWNNENTRTYIGNPITVVRGAGKLRVSVTGTGESIVYVYANGNEIGSIYLSNSTNKTGDFYFAENDRITFKGYTGGGSTGSGTVTKIQLCGTPTDVQTYL